MPSTPRRTTDPGNAGGWIVHVAIADVAHYVRPGTRLDREAQVRGNSVYFPDRVVPMLPERISNDLCSLQGAARSGPASPCASSSTSTATRRSHTFLRAMMRSAAKLVLRGGAGRHRRQAERQVPSRCWRRALKPLWAAYAALAAARDRREPLDLDLPERKIVLDGEGRVERVVTSRAAARRTA